LWVVDFPLLEWNEEDQRYYATHHPFTAPSPKDMDKFFSNDRELEAQVSSDSYDFVLNGTEVGGGSIRIHDAKIQEQMFKVLGFSKGDADYRFGFLINAFKYGAPPHGGLAFGFDRFCALFAGQDTIRDFIAFPKNNMGRDVMDDAPAQIDAKQMDELYLKSTYEEK
ncbi:MAG: aspartate--tRNA ligase, partial [Bacteroidales bacterium]